jgi:16S rRNA (adenine1518-N6/adenine1519-N6)-dimethyltransferase
MTEKIFRAKKSFGQNFLKSEPALNKIITAALILPTDIILEIGPGKGVLTKKLLEKAGKVIAVEKDRELFALLSEKFATEITENKLILVNDDILHFEILEFLSGPRFPGSLSRPDHSKNSESLRYKIVANIPYNITGAILKKFLTSSHQPSCMVLLVQQEVAQRIVARDGKESILSISVKAYGTPTMVMKVPARYFTPAPKVDSAVIKIDNISRKNFESEGVNEETFWKIVKAGFAHKRKQLAGNLKEVVTAEKLKAFGTKRAEDIRLFEWFTLSS